MSSILGVCSGCVALAILRLPFSKTHHAASLARYTRFLVVVEKESPQLAPASLSVPRLRALTDGFDSFPSAERRARSTAGARGHPPASVVHRGGQTIRRRAAKTTVALP